MRYLYTRHLSDLEGYCIHRCNRIINEHTQAHVWYYRGQYKGYTYVIKLVRVTKKKLTMFSGIPFNEMHKNIKNARIEVGKIYHTQSDFTKGIKFSLYDCINYLNEIKFDK